MKTKLILFILLLNSLNPLFSQSQLCGTPQPINPIIYPQEDKNLQAKGSSSAVCINIYFHIVRNTDESNAFDEPNLDLIIENLNELYSPHNILINNGGFDYIDDSELLDITVNEARNINNTENKNSFINYYIVQDIEKNYAGFALSVVSNALFIRSSRIYSATSVHELGHCLGLYHTHYGLTYFDADVGCEEAINGSNCTTCGDLVCDTPADNGEINTNGYTPDLTNIMSYFHLYGLDRNHFTNGQGFRMRYAIQNEPILQNIISNSCTTISQVNNVCYPETKMVTLSNLGSTTTTWTSSSNVQIISSNNSSAEIRALYSNSTDNGWIRATLNNGIVFQENFEVGAPSVSLITLESFKSSPIITGRYTNITARYNGIIDVGQVGYTWEWIVPSSLVRSHGDNISYIHVSPMGTLPSIYIKTRASNGCGCSDWKGKWFTVQIAPEGCTDCPTDGFEIHY